MTTDRALERAKLLCVKAGLDPEGLQRMESDQGPCFITADFTHGLVPGYDEFLVMSPQFVSMKDLANRQLPQSSYRVRTGDSSRFERRVPTVPGPTDRTLDPKVIQRVFLSFGGNEPVANPVGCPACGYEEPEPDFYEPGNRRMLRVEWLVWYAMKHNASSQMAWEAGAKKVIDAEFGEKTRWRVTAYTDPNDPRLVRIKYNDN
jgi:hypothetical protein